MKYRIMLPAIFLLIAILFVAVNVIGIGHGPSMFDFVLYSAYPTAFFTDLLESYLGGPELPWFLGGIAAGAIQYFLIGYFIDKLLQRHRRLKTKVFN